MPGLPPNGSLQGQEIDFLMLLIHGVMGVVFAGWLAYFAVMVLRGWRRKVAVIPGSEGTRWAKTWEAFLIGSEVVLLAGFAIPFWMRNIASAGASGNAAVVRVVAEQYVWNVHYPGPDGKFGRTDPALVSSDNPVGLDRSDPGARDDIVALNELHLPVGKPVRIVLSSKDVIHSFSLPQYRIKRDAIPGQQATVAFTPTATSEELRASMPARYRLAARDTLRDLSLLALTADATSPDGAVVAPAGTLLTPDVVAHLVTSGVHSVMAVPDMPTEIACAQLCGLGHYRMRGILVVEADSSYQAWLAGQESTLTSLTP